MRNSNINLDLLLEKVDQMSDEEFDQQMDQLSEEDQKALAQDFLDDLPNALASADEVINRAKEEIAKNKK